ncbi:MAG: hypothetical protein EPN20_08865 [Magnetospirillum sp.]|nr:MAG: hypothetical protein EPN20_08865 [Magnetospirillum sp.]
MALALHPDHMTAAERLDEVAEILAAGVQRLVARKSTRLSAERGDSSVDFTANRSVYGGENKPRGTRP